MSDLVLLQWLGYDTQPYCPTHYVISDPINVTFLRALASEVIQMNQLIQNQANVLFGADQEIHLVEGFEIEMGSMMEIVLNGCQQ